MKIMKTFLTIILLLLTIPLYSASWIQVDGGVYELDLREKEIEGNLWKFLKANSDRVFEERKKYTYQYQAISKTIIKINAMCFVDPKNTLHKRFIITFDGGSCYFGVNLNTKTGKFEGLHVNGEA